MNRKTHVNLFCILFAILALTGAGPDAEKIDITFDWFKCLAETGEVLGSDEVFISGAVYNSRTGNVETIRWPKNKEAYEDVDAGEKFLKKPRELWSGRIAPGEFVSGVVSVQEQDHGKGADAVAYEIGYLAMGWLGPALAEAQDAIEELFSAGKNDTLGNFEFFVFNYNGSIHKELRALDYLFIQERHWAAYYGGSTDAKPKSLILLLDGPPGDPERYVTSFRIKANNKSLRWTRDDAAHAH